MKRITLDLQQMTSQAVLHAHLKQALHLPEYYGDNLDALYDCLTEIGEATEIIVPQAVQSEQYLGNYGAGLLRVFEQAAEDNSCLKVKIS